LRKKSLWVVLLAFVAFTGTAEARRVSSVSDVSGATVHQVIVKDGALATYKLRVRGLDPAIEGFCLQLFQQVRQGGDWKSKGGGGLCFANSQTRTRVSGQVTIHVDRSKQRARLFGETDLGAALKLRL
jgi:hypothetical protein